MKRLQHKNHILKEHSEIEYVILIIYTNLKMLLVNWGVWHLVPGNLGVATGEWCLCGANTMPCLPPAGRPGTEPTSTPCHTVYYWLFKILALQNLDGKFGLNIYNRSTLGPFSPCCVSWATAAGRVVEMATGVAPTPGILISAPCGALCTALLWFEAWLDSRSSGSSAVSKRWDRMYARSWGVGGRFLHVW